jgi:hypothetical protein
MKNRIVHDYAKLGDAQLGEYGLDKGAKLAANPGKVTSTVTAVLVKAKAQQLIDNVAACNNGTPEDTLIKNQTRTELLQMLDTLANDVENAANVPPGDASLIAALGFTPASASHAASTPNGTAILDVTNPGPNKLAVKLQHDPNAWCYVLEDTLLPNGPTRTVTFTDPDNAVLTGTASGSLHSLRACTMAARNVQSEWSEPVQHMST